MFPRLANLVLAISLLSPIASASVPSFVTAPVAADRISAPPADEPIIAPRAAPDRAAVYQALAARREHNLTSFRIYRNRGVYPHNMVRPGPLNVWRDPDGHLCAAATILLDDGQSELVKHIADIDNNIRLLDVTEGALMDWMLTSGLTVEEIDRIQVPGFMPEPQPTDYSAEDARLRKDYTATDTALGKKAATAKSLEQATDRLMQHPELAWQLLDRAAPQTAKTNS
jgi:hypothetical protein